MQSRSRFIRNAVIAAIVGSSGGAAAGVWSVRDRTPSVALTPRSTTAVPASARTTDGERRGQAASAATPDDESGRAKTLTHQGLVPSVAVSTKGVAGPTMPTEDTRSLLQQALALAQRPDVNGLVALREGVSRRAEERGDQESPEVRRLIGELDRYLAEARQLRLKLDGDELRKMQTSNRPR